MVVLQKSENQVYSDIVRSLRQNFRPEPIQPSPPRSERKVRIRTNRHYRSQPPDDHWKERYNRHMKQSVRGFYTPAHIPYASVGDVCLDVRELVVSTVGLKQSSEVINNLIYFDILNRCMLLFVFFQQLHQSRHDEKSSTCWIILQYALCCTCCVVYIKKT